MLADNKSEGFPYSLPSVGLGAHPGVQAIRLLGGVASHRAAERRNGLLVLIHNIGNRTLPKIWV